jgi:chorismate mutase
MRLSPCLAFSLWCLAFLTGCPASPAPTPASSTSTPADTKAVDRLLTLMGDRLALMHDVAKWKWNHKIPIADAERERRVLDAVGDRAAAMGLDRDEVRRFFAAQIEAGKMLQQANFKDWEEGQHVPFVGVASLAEMREKIDALNEQMLESLAATRNVPSQMVLARSEVVLRGKGVSPAIRTASTSPWREPQR